MVTRGYWSDLRSLSKRLPAAFELLTLITERMSKSNALVISQATIGQILGYGRTTVHKAIRLLEDEKWVQVVKIGTANAYVVNSKVVWRDHSGKRFGSFYAEVLVSEDEQEKTADKLDNLQLKHLQILKWNETPIVSGEDPASQPSFNGLEPDLPSIPAISDLSRSPRNIDPETGEIE